MSDMHHQIFERLGRIEVGLAEHMRRTEIAEKRLELVEEAQDEHMRYQAQWAGAGKLLSVLGTLAGALGVCWKVLG